MLTLVLRRARVQRRLLAAVVLLVAIAAALVGVCVLLLGVTQERAFHAAMLRTRPADVDVTAFLGEIPGGDLADVRDQAAGVVTGVLAPLRPTVDSAASARMRQLGSDDRLGYLATVGALPQRATLVSGRWPGGTGGGAAEAVVPEATARLLDLHPGDRVTLGREIGIDGVERPVRVVVVGTFRPLADAGWDGDPLAGAGFDPAYSDGAVTAPAYGPFVVDDAAFLATRSSVDRLRVVAHPTLALADEKSVRTAVAGLDHASELLSSRVGTQAHISRVGSDLGQTLDRVDAQQASTRSTVLVVLVLGAALSLAAVLLAGWLVAAVREDERALLVAFGLSRRQQLGTSLAEALLLAAASALLAVPAAAVVHAWLTHLPDLAAAGLSQSPSAPWQLVVAVLVAVLVLALALVLTVPDLAVAPVQGVRRGPVRYAPDLLLLAAAVAGWWELHARPSTAGTGVDVVLTAAPVLCVAALTLVAARLVPLLLAGLAGAATRSRALVVPLATRQATRRPHRGTAMVLVTAAVATAVLGVALRSTWERSQRDQAALRVGTDLSFTLPTAPGPQDAAAVAAAVGTPARGSAVSAVVDRPLALGRYVGDVGSPPVVVAVDTRHAGALLRGRTDGSWAALGARLEPDQQVQGVHLPHGGAGIEVAGGTPEDLTLSLLPTVVVQDRAGFRSSVAGAAVPLDGRPHEVRWLAPVAERSELVAVRLDLSSSPADIRTTSPTADVSATVRIPGASGSPARSWHVPTQPDNAVQGATLAVRPAGDATELAMTAGVEVTALPYADATVLGTAFTPPPDVPVAVSQDLVDAIGAKVGGELSAIVGEVDVPLRVTAVVPTVPSAPGRAAVLADADTLSRSLIAAGRLDPVVDAWWVGHPSSSTVRALRALQIGDVTTREDVTRTLAQGPLGVTTPSALLTLALAAAVLLLVGVALLLSAERQRRTAEVARLRALGLTPRTARRVLLVEHAAFLVPLVLAGALVGVVAAVAVGPHLVRSDLGAAPVPAAVVAWPWTGEALVVVGLLLGSLGIAAAATAVHVRRSDPALLRSGDQ